ncbi:MAG: Fe-S cluster assembly protein SufD [Tahibacter sp.]
MSQMLQSLLRAPSVRDLGHVESELPSTRHESWKYTNLRALGARQFAPGDAQAAARAIDSGRWVLPGVDGPCLVFVNGVLRHDLSSLEQVPLGIHVEYVADSHSPKDLDRGPSALFDRLNARFASQGFMLRVDDGVCVERPVHVVHVGVAAESDSAWHVRDSVDLGVGSSLSLVVHHVGYGAHAHLANHHSTYRLGASAALNLLQIQDEAEGASLFRRSDVSISESGRLDHCSIELGASLARHELNVELLGQGAVVESRGAFALRGRQHGESRLEIVHVAGDTRCDLLWRGVADERARGVLHGAIKIAAGADGSDARLSSKNLLLSPHAEINAQPVLEIHADEVKAAHGATVGQLDERALFYLRSRGISQIQARALLTSAFCATVLDGLPSPLREHLEELLVSHLPKFDEQDESA